MTERLTIDPFPSFETCLFIMAILFATYIRIYIQIMRINISRRRKFNKR